MVFQDFHSFYDEEVAKSPEIMEPIWINYHGTRILREKMARKKWMELCAGEVKEHLLPSSLWIERSIEKCLNPFISLTKKNPPLCTRLVHLWFNLLQKIPPFPLHGQNILERDSFLHSFENRWNSYTSWKERMSLPPTEIENLSFSEEKNFAMIQFLEALPNPFAGPAQSDPLSVLDAWEKGYDGMVEIMEREKFLLSSISREKVFFPQEILQEYSQNLHQRENFLQKSKEWKEKHKEMHDAFQDYHEKLDLLCRSLGDVSFASQKGWDLSQGLLKKQDWVDLEKIASFLEHQDELKKALSLLGRNREGEASCEGREGGKKYRKKNKIPSFSPSELYGVQMGNSLERLIPWEWIYLSHPLFKKLFYVKWFEKRLLTYELRQNPSFSPEKKKDNSRKGAILFCVDTSASMSGTSEQMAKALVLTGVRMARAEDRHCMVILFGGKGDLVEWELVRDPKAMENLIHFLFFSFGGGTDFMTPLQRAWEWLQKDLYSTADIVVVTDGKGSISKDFERELGEMKKKLSFQIFLFLTGKDGSRLSFGDHTLHLPPLLFEDF